MSEMFQCQDKATLVAFLYDEIDASRRRRIEDHIRQCVACAREVDALSTVRVALAAWAPPDTSQSGATLVPPPLAAMPTRWWADLPVWARLSAAAIIVAVSASIANLQVHTGPSGVVVSTGWLAPASAAVVSPPATAEVDAEAWKTALAALESRLHDEIRADRSAGRALPAAVAAAPSGETGAVLKQVQALIAASEHRQQQELALRVMQVNHDMDIQRRADLVRIEQGLGQFEGRTGAEMARQRQLLNYVMRVSAPPQP